MSEGVERNMRAIEGSVVTDFSDRMSHGGYRELTLFPELFAVCTEIGR